MVSGFCLVEKLLEVGVNVVLGMDGVVSNNDLDMFGEMCIVVLLVKGVLKNFFVVLVYVVIELVIINGVKVLGIDDIIGSLEIGKLVDFIVVNMNDISC